MSGGSVNANRKWGQREERETKTIHFPPAVLERINQARGTQSLNAWVIEACSAALDVQEAS